jgi:hypothetical protein
MALKLITIPDANQQDNLLAVPAVFGPWCDGERQTLRAEERGSGRRVAHDHDDSSVALTASIPSPMPYCPGVVSLIRVWAGC